MSVELLKSTIREDQKVIKFAKLFDEKDFDIDFKELNSEVESLMKSRLSRTYNHRKDSEILEAMTSDQAFRSRLVEIILSLTSAEKFLDRSLRTLQEYIFSKYYMQIKSVYSTKGDREAFVASTLKTYRTYQEKVGEVKYKCQIVMEDIDKSSYTFKHLIDFSIASKRTGIQ